MAELMKGNVFAKRKHTVKYPCIAEVKYDEIRVHVKLARTGHGDFVQFLSYDGKPLHNLGLYSQQFMSFFRGTGLTELDMGLEVNGNFNDSYRWARSSTGIPKEKLDKKTGKVAPALDHSMVQFYLFDLPESAVPFQLLGDPNFTPDRRWLRKQMRDMLCDVGLPVHTPQGLTVDSEGELYAFFDLVRGEGREGLMVKSMDHTYEKGKRIDGWLKMKPEEEADGEIVGMTEAISEDGKPLGRAGSITLRIPGENNTCSFASPHGIPHELGTLMWQNPHQYIGQWAQFNYMERDRQGGYRHPTFGRLRDAKA